MIIVKQQKGDFAKEFSKEKDAQNFIDVLKRNNSLRQYELVSDKYKLDYNNGEIKPRRVSKKD